MVLVVAYHEAIDRRTKRDEVEVLTRSGVPCDATDGYEVFELDCRARRTREAQARIQSQHHDALRQDARVGAREIHRVEERRSCGVMRHAVGAVAVADE